MLVCGHLICNILLNGLPARTNSITTLYNLVSLVPLKVSMLQSISGIGKICRKYIPSTWEKKRENELIEMVSIPVEVF